MRTIRAVITADNHLNRFYDRMAPQKLADRRRRLRQGFHLAVQYAIDTHAEIFLQAGDLFDTPDPRNLDREFVAAELARLRAAGVAAYAIGGNHDTPKQRTEQGGALPQATYAQLGGLHLFTPDSQGVVTQIVAMCGLRVAIGALPWSPLIGADTDPLANVEWAPEADVGIFLFHHSVEGHIFPGVSEPIVSTASLDRLRNTQLVVAGHVHHRATWRVGPMQVLIPGATELMTFGETGEPSFTVAVLERSGVASLDHVKVPAQPRRQLTVRTSELHADAEACAAIKRGIEPLCSADALLRLHLEGPITREGYRALDLAALYTFGVDRNFYFDIETAGLYVQDEFGDRAAGGVRLSQRDELARCADGLMSETDDLEERELLEETKQALLAYYETEVPV